MIGKQSPRKEKLNIPKEKPYIFLEGYNASKTIVKWNDHAQMDQSATFTSLIDNFVAEGINFEANKSRVYFSFLPWIIQIIKHTMSICAKISLYFSLNYRCLGFFFFFFEFTVTCIIFCTIYWFRKLCNKLDFPICWRLISCIHYLHGKFL